MRTRHGADKYKLSELSFHCRLCKLVSLDLYLSSSSRLPIEAYQIARAPQLLHLKLSGCAAPDSLAVLLSTFSNLQSLDLNTTAPISYGFGSGIIEGNSPHTLNETLLQLCGNLRCFTRLSIPAASFGGPGFCIAHLCICSVLLIVSSYIWD